MSIVKVNAAQIGQSVTATNNFCWYQPSSPDGTVRLGNGNSGSVTDLVTLTSAGNLGIGTSSPSFPLHIATAAANILLAPSTTTNNALLRLTNAGGNAYLGLDGSAGGLGSAYGLHLFHAGAYPIVFSTSGAERMRLDSSGNLALGLSSTSYRFDMAGTATAGMTVLQQIRTGTGNSYGFQIKGNYTTEDYLIQNYYSGYLAFGTNNTERMRLDSSGNLGLGVTPSAMTTLNAMQLGGTAIIAGQQSSVEALYFGSNWYYNSGFKYKQNGYATYCLQNAGTHVWYTAPSGTAGNAISFTQAMTLDASGRLLINQTSASAASAGTKFQSATDNLATGSLAGWFFENRSGGVTTNTNWYGWYGSGGNVYFYNGAANVATINPSTGVYTATSDANKKKDFEDSDIGLDAVLKLKPTFFRMQDAAADSPKELGFIAQDVKNVISQAYVENTVAEDASGTETTYIGLNDRPILAALTRAIQELHQEIETLKGKIA